MRRSGFVYLLVSTFALAALGCSAASTSKGKASGSSSGGSGGSGGDTGTGAVSSGGTTSLLVDAGDAGAPAQTTLLIAPADPVLDLVVVDGQVTQTTLSTGGAVPLTFTATADGMPTDANWTLDRGEIGTLTADTGVFTPGGVYAGLANVTAQAGSAIASTTVT